MEYRVVLGVVAVLLGFAAYIPYFRGILSGRTKPHAFSFFVWTVLTGIVFFAQLASGGGPGAWAIGATTLMCFAVFLFALVRGDRKFPLFDWLCLAAALAALALWRLTSDPTAAVVLITLTDTIAYLPSFRKSYHKPDEETASMFAIDSSHFLLSIAALSTLSLATWLYPAVIGLTDAVYAGFVLMRRRQLARG